MVREKPHDKESITALFVSPDNVNCQMCEYKATGQFDLVDHLTTQHGGKIIEVPKNGQPNEIQMEQHKNQNHENQKPAVECKYCPFNSSNMTLLKLHEKDHINHYGLQPSMHLKPVTRISPEKGKIRKGNLGCDTCDYTSMDIVCLASHFQ